MDPTTSTLVMDLGGVTCRWLPDRRLVALGQLAGLPADTVDQLVFESGFDDAGERGQFSLDDFAANLRSILGLPATEPSDQALRATWAQASEPDDAVLETIGAATCRTALFTNNGPLLEAAMGHELSDVGDCFETLVFSWHLGATKPDPTAFVGAAERLDAEAADLFFVDDSRTNVEAAQAAGWQGHHFSDPAELRFSLAEIGLL